ncbi:metal-dependent hydrolase [Polycyclovorans algicola]|uniref:metal-dependent hydrolase n=1 Tax=Polycyclovorans algicola TaxID=616992 RepID=UPI000AE5E932|nr:metal-dependent hydrolase [Polycyclovorans algicola]
MNTKTAKTTSVKRNATSQGVMPVRRDVKFTLPQDRVHDWADGNVQFTHLMNTMSLVIPVGERFFIDAVRHYRDAIQDPELKRAATAFIGQEAMHGREHDEYNARVFERLPEAATFERSIKGLLDWFKDRTPPSTRLSATIALEHLTAIMADGLLNEPHLREKSEPGYAALWEWHALEETEHKGVAYDVWEATQGKGVRAYAERSAGLLLATTIFWGRVTPAHLRFVRSEGKMGDVKGWREFYRVAFGEIGFLRKMARPWLAYFRPDFHPWDHDNRHFLAGIEDWVQRFERESRAPQLAEAA